MYTLTQNSTFSDEIELKHQDGTSEILSIHLSISPETVKKYRSLEVELIDLQKKANETPASPAVLEKIGETIVSLFSLLFGEENCEKILQFYSDDFIQMTADLFPYIQNIIIPKFQELAKQRKQTFKKKIWK